MSKEVLYPDSLSPDHIRGYLAAEYRIPELLTCLRIGEYNAALESWCLENGCDSFAVITPENPASAKLGDTENAARWSRMASLMHENGFHFLTTEHHATAGEPWPVEKGMLVNAELDTLLGWAKEFGQAGVLWGTCGSVPLLYLDRSFFNESVETEFSKHASIRFF